MNVNIELGLTRSTCRSDPCSGSICIAVADADTYDDSDADAAAYGGDEL